ncbi:MAG: family 43 glycosylhydrolase [Lachnospiraceae bacterium]|nr:family 43 glycosylhydrolase [Lachnospiraceae bacterium]
MRGKVKHTMVSVLLCGAMALAGLQPWTPPAVQAAQGQEGTGQGKTGRAGRTDIDKSLIRATAGSESAGEEAAKAVDGDPGTIWHSSWAEGHPTVPLSITLELDEAKEGLTQLRYLPRQDVKGSNPQWNGDILSYEVWVSSTDQQESSFQKVAVGDWAQDKEEKSATFAPVTAKYIRLTATHTKGNNDVEYDQYASAAEITLSCGGSVDLEGDRARLRAALAKAKAYLEEAGAGNAEAINLQGLADWAEVLLQNQYAVAEDLGIMAYSLLAELERLQEGKPAVTYSSFTPNSQWLDDRGAMIQAHGGGVLWDDRTQKYYWYGEHKGEDNIKNGCVAAIGVSCYSSTDLYNWKNEGIALPVFNHPAFLAGGEAAADTPMYLAESSEEYQAAKTAGKAVSPYDSLEKYNTASYIAQLNSLYEGSTAAEKKSLYQKLNWDSVLERPKVLYNSKNGNYVMWFHKDGEGAGNYSLAQVGIAVSDSPTGPFRLLDTINPLGKESRDMALFQDDDGKAYLLYSSEDNWTLYLAELNEDYTGLTGNYSRNYVDRDGSKGIYAREAPAIFKYDGNYYVITSGCTGWDPNVMGYSVTGDIRMGMSKDGGDGPFQMDGLKNPCIGTDANISFHGQSTFVLPVQGKEGCFIYMGDKWEKNNLKDSRYQWLPIQIDPEEKALVLAWDGTWEMGDFETLNSQAKIGLNRVIRQAGQLEAAEYDFGQERWQTFQQAFHTSMDLPFGTAEAEITKMKDAILQSMEGLKRWKPLDAALAEAGNRAEAAYTAESWKGVEEACDRGKSLGEGASDAQILQAAEAVWSALGKLVEVKMETEEISLKGKAVLADSQQPGNEAEKAVDGDSGTIWHCRWGGGATSLPHYLTIDLGQAYEDLYQLQYLPRQDKDSNGIATRYRILTSNSKKEIGQLSEADFTEVRTGSWEGDKTEKSAIFRTKEPARYLRFVITAGLGDFASAAEIRLLRGTPEVEEEPKPAEVKVTQITVTGEKAKLLKGQKASLRAVAAPENATNKKVIWSSSNGKVASVNANGVVTALSAGTAVIRATAADGSGIVGDYPVTVWVHQVKKITLKSNYKTVAAGKKATITATVATTGKTADKSLTFYTSNKKYATVSAKGVVSAKKAGAGKTVTITAAAKDGSGKKASVKIKIVKDAVKKITLSCKKKTIAAGKKTTVKAAVKATGKKANKALAYSSSNKKYATVNAKGVVTAKKAGKGKTVTIRAASTDGTNKKASIKIKIK